MLPLPVIVNVPPAAKVPPICRFPLVKAPVLNVTVPRFPLTSPKFPNPFTTINVEPVRLSPELSPDSVPPLLVKSTELLANAVIGSARARRAMNSKRLIHLPPEYPTLPTRVQRLSCFCAGHSIPWQELPCTRNAKGDYTL